MTLFHFTFFALGLVFCFGDAAALGLRCRWRGRMVAPGQRRFRLMPGMLPGAVVLGAVSLKVLTKLLLPWVR